MPDTNVEKVKMTDGREVEFAGKRRLLKDSWANDEGHFLRLDFRNGETRTIHLPDSLISKFALHGAEQKYGDAVAGVKEDIDDMVLEIDDLDSRIQAGEWSTQREAGGMSGTSVLLRALVEYTGKPVEALRAFLKGKKQAEKLALRENGPEPLRAIIARIESEKASKAAHVDTDALLAEVGDL